MRNDARFEDVPWKNDATFEDELWENVCFCLISIVWVHFYNKSEKFPFSKSLEYFNIFFIKKNDVRFEYVWQKQSLIRFNLRCLRRNLIIS